MIRRRIIMGVVGFSFILAVSLGLGAGTGGPLDPTLWGIGSADAPYCHQPTWFLRPLC